MTHSEFLKEIEARKKKREEYFSGLGNYYEVDIQEIKVPPLDLKNLEPIEEERMSRQELQLLIFAAGMIKALPVKPKSVEEIQQYCSIYSLLLDSIWTDGHNDKRLAVFVNALDQTVRGLKSPLIFLLDTSYVYGYEIKLDVKIENPWVSNVCNEAMSVIITDSKTVEGQVFNWLRSSLFHGFGLWALGFQKEVSHAVYSATIGKPIAELTFKLLGDKIIIRDREIPIHLQVCKGF